MEGTYTYLFLEALSKEDPTNAFELLIRQSGISFAEAKFILEVENDDYAAACAHILVIHRNEIIQNGGYSEPESDIPDPMISLQHKLAKASNEAFFLAETERAKKRKEADQDFISSIKSMFKKKK